MGELVCDALIPRGKIKCACLMALECIRDELSWFTIGLTIKLTIGLTTILAEWIADKFMIFFVDVFEVNNSKIDSCYRVVVRPGTDLMPKVIHNGHFLVPKRDSNFPSM